MLAIQPVSVNRNYQSSSFKGSWDKQDVDNEIGFIEGQVSEMNELINDQYVPNSVKKPFKFFRVIANAAIDGLAVFGSAIMLGNFLKKSYGRISSTGFISNKVKPLAKDVIKELKLGVKDGLNALKETERYERFVKTDYGAKSVDKLVKLKNYISNLKINTKKIGNGVAATLGVGAGITGAYEATMEKPVQNNENYDVEYEEVA